MPGHLRQHRYLWLDRSRSDVGPAFGSRPASGPGTSPAAFGNAPLLDGSDHSSRSSRRQPLSISPDASSSAGRARFQDHTQRGDGFGRSSLRGRLLKTRPGHGGENQPSDGEQWWDWQSEAVPERGLESEQSKLEQGSRAFAGPRSHTALEVPSRRNDLQSNTAAARLAAGTADASPILSSPAPRRGRRRICAVRVCGYTSPSRDLGLDQALHVVDAPMHLRVRNSSFSGCPSPRPQS